MIVETTDAASRPEPHPDAYSMAYRRRASIGRQLVRRCAMCGEPPVPTRHLCPFCLPSDLPRIETSGKRSVYTLNVMHRAPMSKVSAITPYVVAPIDHAEGPRVIARIVGSNAHEPPVGDPIRVCCKQRQRCECKLPRFGCSANR